VIQDYFWLDSAGQYKISAIKIPSASRPGIYNMRPRPAEPVPPTSALLQWDAVGMPTSYDVYLGAGISGTLAPVFTSLTSSSCTVTGLKWNQRYYWYVVGHFPTGDISSPVSWFRASSFGQIKKLPSGTGVDVAGAIVTAAFPDCFYVEDDVRASGIRVDMANHGQAVGFRADFIGTVITGANGERRVAANSATASEARSTRPVSAGNRLLGGGDWYYNPTTGTGQIGVVGGSGLNNIGRFVTTWGRVTGIGTGYLYIDDGSALNDGLGSTGVRVICDPTGYAVGNYLFVTGISSCFKNQSGAIVRQILARSSADVRKVSP
jgi:hypothetical protein